MRNIFYKASLLLSVTLLMSCAAKLPYNEQAIYKDKIDDAIPVLNVATFHMGETSDASSTEFNENDEKKRQEVKKVAQMLAKFKPTIIVIESLPERDSIRRADYLDYVQHPDKKFKNPDERDLLAYEIGRLSGAE